MGVIQLLIVGACVLTVYTPLVSSEEVEVECSDGCAGSLCFGTKPDECCHSECALGCAGPRPNDCWTCQHFLNEGSCVPQCPTLQVYDSTKFMLVPNPVGKYAHGVLCVKECPAYMFIEGGACVDRCSEGKHLVDRDCL